MRLIDEVDKRMALIKRVHPASAYLMVKKAFHPLDDSGGHQGTPLQKMPHPDPLPGGEGTRNERFLDNRMEARRARIKDGGVWESAPGG